MSIEQNNEFIIYNTTKEIPQNITHLKFNYSFNHKVNNLPQNITYINFGNCYNQKVDNLPKNLTHLYLNYYFEQKIDKLPKNLIFISLKSANFNQKIDNLPKNLTQLTLFSLCFNESINCLPKSLTSLAINWCINSDIKLPKNVNYLLLTCNNNLINNIPEHIEKLNIYFENDHISNKNVENLPLTIKEIIIKDKEYKKYIKIPFGTILTIKIDDHNK
jgi:hypothetical protein